MAAPRPRQLPRSSARESGDLSAADFLALRPRAAKPRTVGLNCLIDGGLGPRALEDLLDGAAHAVDFVKFGWGTGVVSPALARKIELLRRHDVGFWFGGTLFELAHAQGRLDAYVGWLQDIGATHVEVSDGTVGLPEAEKLALIERLARGFTVLSEVGSKDPKVTMPPDAWVASLTRELEAGAWKVITEGRESGTNGFYSADGEARGDLMDAILASSLDTGRIIFEAPQKRQQIWLMKRVGYAVNLGNVPPADAINLETLRLGLRSDTFYRPALN
jgi:phosphosulfolactate synthase